MAFNIGKAVQVEVKVLANNTTYSKGPILAESGLSVFIETESEEGITARILMDAGKTGTALLNNVKQMKLNLGRVDAIVVSHNHHDHTTGLLKALTEMRKKVPIIMHPDVFKQPRYRIQPKSGKLRYIGPPFLAKALEDAGGILTFSKKPIPIAGGVIATGEIARVTGFEKVEGFYMVDNGVFKEDQILDDQALVVRTTDDSLIIFTGCGHSGVINTIHYALRLTNAKSVRAVIGGFHLIDAKEERIDKTVRELKRVNPQIISPMHCTGFKAAMKIAEAFPEAFREFYCGDTMKITV